MQGVDYQPGNFYQASEISLEDCRSYCVSEVSDNGEKGRRIYLSYLLLSACELSSAYSESTVTWFCVVPPDPSSSPGKATSPNSSDNIHSSSHTAWGELVSRNK